MTEETASKSYEKLYNVLYSLILPVTMSMSAELRGLSWFGKNHDKK